jgi:hypothetical protein
MMSDGSKTLVKEVGRFSPDMIQTAALGPGMLTRTR